LQNQGHRHDDALQELTQKTFDSTKFLLCNSCQPVISKWHHP
jgi:hypothetical protein